MKIYCLCRGVAVENPPNRIISDGLIGEAAWSKQPVVALESPMTVASMGTIQVIVDKETGVTRRHYPNVDLLVCSSCGATVALEG